MADWALSRWIGECPDEKWDSYLAKYSTTLPHEAGRAGTFQPFTSVWDRLFPSSDKEKDKMLRTPTFTNETDFKAHMSPPFTLHNIPYTHQGFSKTPASSNGKLSKKTKEESGARGISKSKIKKRKTSGDKIGIGGFFSKKNSNLGEGTRKPIKFGADLSSDSSGDDDDETLTGSHAASSPIVETKRPGLTRDASSAATLVDRGRNRSGLGEKEAEKDMGVDVDYDKEIKMVKDKLRKNSGGAGAEEVEYSDYEEDLTTQMDAKECEGGWVPGFMKRQQPYSPSTQQSHPVPAPVPATPSLIRAIDRIAVAQKDAFGSVVVSSQSRDASAGIGHGQETTTPIPLTGREMERERERAPGWGDFWREVGDKANANTKARR